MRDVLRQLSEKKISQHERFAHPVGTLWLFTDLGSATIAQEQGAALGPYEGGVRGTELFARLPAGLQQISINPGSPAQETLQLRAPSFANVGVWADVVAFESKLSGPTTKAMTDAVESYDA